MATSGELSFAAGQTSRTVTVLVNGDTLDEANETFFVNLSSPTNVAIADGQGSARSQTTTPLPSLSVNNVTVAEGNTGTVAATFTLTLAPASGRTVSVDYATADVTAIAPGDYTAGSGTVTFAAGETTKQVTVLVNGDTLDESNETFTVNLSNAPNATIADSQGVGTITDDDPLPTLSVDDAIVSEGDTGTVAATFTVSLGSPSGRSVTVQYATVNGTAIGARRLPVGERHAHLHSRPDRAHGRLCSSTVTSPTRSTRPTPSSSQTPRTRRSPTARVSARSSTTTASPRSRSTT